MKDYMPKISVIIPIYNVQKYLEECINSVLSQTLRDIEVICVDDGSTDNSADILNEYAHLDNRINIISKKNTGYGDSMNIGINTASGKYICFVESDDYVDSHMLEELYSIAERDNLQVLKADSKEFIDDNSERIFTYVSCLPESEHQLYGRVLDTNKDLITFKGYVYTWAGIYNREFILNNRIKHNTSPGASYQDNGFWFLSTMHAERIEFIQRAYYNLRRDNENSSFFKTGKLQKFAYEYDYIIKEIENSSVVNRKPFLEYAFYYRFINYVGAMNAMKDDSELLSFSDRLKKDISTAFFDGIINPMLFDCYMMIYFWDILHGDIYRFKYVGLNRNIYHRLKGTKGILIYGAGKMGRESYNYLCGYGLKDDIKRFCVTQKDNDNQEIDGVEVTEIDNFTNKELADYLIVIAVGKKTEAIIRDNLSEKGYYNPILPHNFVRIL